MEFLPTRLSEVVEVRPKVFTDERGYFLETYHANRFSEHGLTLSFVQDNLSRSYRGVLRGLHFQIRHPQGKLVTCLNGEIFDVAVDLRRSSETFGQWVAVILSSELRNSLYIPPGFAHGFCTLSPSADVFYKCTDVYVPQSERTLRWDDPDVGIAWPEQENFILSDKDRIGKPLKEVECYP